MRLIALAMVVACAAASADTMSTMTTEDGLASVRYDVAVWNNVSPSTKLPDGFGMLSELIRRNEVFPDTKNLFYLCDASYRLNAETCIVATLIEEAAPVAQARTYSGKAVQVADGVYLMQSESSKDSMIGMVAGDGKGYAALHIIGRKGLMQKYAAQVRALLDGLRYNKL